MVERKTKERFFPILSRFRIDSVMYSCLGPADLRNHSMADLESVILLDPHSTYLFPSHFFEVNDYPGLLALLEKYSISFWVQISLGKELSDYLPTLLLLKKQIGLKFLGVEIVIDRKLNPFQRKQIDSVLENEIPFRFLAIPFSDRDPYAMFSTFPEIWRNQLHVFFPEKQSKTDPHLTNDEKLLLERKIELQIQDLKLNPHPSLNSFVEDAPLQKLMKSVPSGGGLLEQNNPKKKLLIAFLKIKFLRPVIVIPYALLWICHDPKTALSMPLRYLRAPTILFYKTIDLLVWLAYRLFEVLYLIRHLVIYSYVYLYRLISFLHRFSISAFYRLYPAIRNPIWFMESHFPLVFKFTLFPFCKAYWFFEYQLKKILVFFTKEDRWSQ